jgi:hypothetical protein
LHDDMQQQQTFSTMALEQDWILPNGYRIHYRKVGSGPPLLLIHGLVA